MTDKHPEAFTVHLGGKARTVKLKLSSFRIAEMRHGVKVSTDMFEDFTLEALPRLVWIGLLADDPDVTEDDVMVWLAQSDDEAEIIGKALKAVERMGETVSKLMGAAAGAVGKAPPAETPDS